MIFIYSILGFGFILLSVYILMYRDKVSREMKKIKEKEIEIQGINCRLDDIQSQLNELDQPLKQLNDFSKIVLKYLK